MAKTVHRYKAGQSGSSQPVETVKVAKDGSEKQMAIKKPAERRGALLLGAEYILGRLPFTKTQYRQWPRAQRIGVGYVLWLIALPIFPLAVIIMQWTEDPINFRKSFRFVALAIITVLWFWVLVRYING